MSKKEKKAASPYQKYGKVAFSYTHKNCGHKNTTVQSAPNWKGRVCTICNTIVERLDDHYAR